MSKSTPISQLPLNTDILDEDDAAVREVQEVLNQISQTLPSDQPSAPLQPQSPKPQNRQAGAQAAPQTIYYPLPPSYEALSTARPATPEPQVAQQPSSWENYTQVTPDIRSAVLVVIACAIVQIVPVETFVARVFPQVASVAHSHVVLKALCAGLIFFLVSKYV